MDGGHLMERVASKLPTQLAKATSISRIMLFTKIEITCLFLSLQQLTKKTLKISRSMVKRNREKSAKDMGFQLSEIQFIKDSSKLLITQCLKMEFMGSM